MFITLLFALAVFLATFSAEVPWVAVHTWLSKFSFCVAPIKCEEVLFLANTLAGGGKIEEKIPVGDDGCESLSPKS